VVFRSPPPATSTESLLAKNIVVAVVPVRKVTVVEAETRAILVVVGAQFIFPIDIVIIAIAVSIARPPPVVILRGSCPLSVAPALCPSLVPLSARRWASKVPASTPWRVEKTLVIQARVAAQVPVRSLRVTCETPAASSPATREVRVHSWRARAARMCTPMIAQKSRPERVRAGRLGAVLSVAAQALLSLCHSGQVRLQYQT
jgi:hypothetical protein